MRTFTLNNPNFDIPASGGLLFRWAGLDMEIAHQLAFEEQYLQFQRHLLENLQSIPAGNTTYKPSKLSLSVRAGAVKSYIVFACSIIEGALAAWGESLGLTSSPGSLYKQTLGGLLRSWECGGKPRSEVAPIWGHLQLLREYRNFIHLARAASSPDAYWQQILDREVELLRAVDESIEYLSSHCNGV